MSLEELEMLAEFAGINIEDLDQFELEDLLLDFPELEDDFTMDLDTIRYTDFSQFEKKDTVQTNEYITTQIEKMVKDMDLTNEQIQDLQKLQEDLTKIDNQTKTITSDTVQEAINQGTISNSREVEFVSERDEKVCPKCEDVDGDVFPVDTRTKIIDGPLLPDDQHPNCRCLYRQPYATPFDTSDPDNDELSE